eukprot:208717-Chlamydomonas_euryale.AAC.2
MSTPFAAQQAGGNAAPTPLDGSHETPFELTLGLHNSMAEDEDLACNVKLFCPIWVDNRSGLDLEPVMAGWVSAFVLRGREPNWQQLITGGDGRQLKGRGEGVDS